MATDGRCNWIDHQLVHTGQEGALLVIRFYFLT